MSREKLRWRVRHRLSPHHIALGQELGLDPIVIALLRARGYRDTQAIQAFFHGTLGDLPPASSLKDIRLAANRVVRAIEENERIMIYGDYDVDGITATAALIKGLGRLGAQVSYYIPHRTEEGYGLNIEALAGFAQEDISLVITVDCGISAHVEAEFARGIGLDLIVTDHHLPPPVAVDALAIINPKQESCNYPFKELAGVGVAYQLLIEVAQLAQPDIEMEDLLSFVALGTIADVVSLTGPNRIMVKCGLDHLCRSVNIGIGALCSVAGFQGKEITASQVAFGLAPRLNACGRMGQASLAVELLLTDDPIRAHSIAQELNDLNAQRQATEQKIAEEAHAQIQSIPDWQDQYAFVLSSTDWHPGVIGIVASRLVDAYHRPVLLLSVEEGIYKGSGRSIKGFHLFDNLSQHAHLLLKYGGHELAAGLSVAEEKFDEFKASMIQKAAEQLTSEDLIPRIYADLELPAQRVNLDLVRQLESMAPFGMDNPSPIFVVRDVQPKYVRQLSAGRHFKGTVQKEGSSFDAVAWRMGEYIADFKGPLDLIGALERNQYNGQESVQLVLRDWRRSELQISLLSRCLELTSRLPAIVYLHHKQTMENLSELLAIEPPMQSQLAATRCEQSSIPSGVLLRTNGQRIETVTTDQVLATDYVVLADPPYEALGESNVLVAFDDDQIKRAKMVVFWLYPDRQRLVMFYRWLRTSEYSTWEDVVSFLQQHFLNRREAEVAGRTMLAILKELQLVQTINNSYCLVLNNRKVDLQQSAHFMTAQRNRDELLSWYDQLTSQLSAHHPA